MFATAVALVCCLLLGADHPSAQDVPDNTLLILKYTVDDLIDNFEKGIPNELPLPDLSVKGGAVAIKSGKLTNLKSLKKTDDVETEKMDDGGYKFSVGYSLGKLDVLYDKFTYTYGWFKKEGKLVSSFKTDNSLTLQLRIPPLAQAMAEYGKGKCFIYVDNVGLMNPKLTIDRVYTGGLTGGRTTTFVLPMVSKGLQEAIQKGVGQAFEDQFTSFIPAQLKKTICGSGEKKD